jgi:hypothetical protein
VFLDVTSNLCTGEQNSSIVCRFEAIAAATLGWTIREEDVIPPPVESKLPEAEFLPANR